MIELIKLLLSIINMIIRRVDDTKRMEIANDSVIRQHLAQLVVKMRIAKEIDVRSGTWSDDDVDDVLQPYYRAEGHAGDDK